MVVRGTKIWLFGLYESYALPVSNGCCLHEVVFRGSCHICLRLLRWWQSSNLQSTAALGGKHQREEKMLVVFATATELYTTHGIIETSFFAFFYQKKACSKHRAPRRERFSSLESAKSGIPPRVLSVSGLEGL